MPIPTALATNGLHGFCGPTSLITHGYQGPLSIGYFPVFGVPSQVAVTLKIYNKEYDFILFNKQGPDIYNK